MTITFVCTGNTCRSPMAAAIARRVFAERDYVVTSRGLSVWGRGRAEPNAEKALESMGIDMGEHISTLFDAADAVAATVILTMTAEHKAELLRRRPDCAGKTFTLAEYAGENGDVADPFGGGIGVYKQCADEIRRLIEKIKDKI